MLVKTERYKDENGNNKKIEYHGYTDTDGNIVINCTVETMDIEENNKNDETPEPTQADRIEENQLVLMEAVASMYEESLENRLNGQEVQATIYETLLEMQEGM